MNIIINISSMTPIYEQIIDGIKKLIIKGDICEGDALPSVRVLSRELNISALTVKKAYDILEADGFIKTVHGKGSYIAPVSSGFLLEEKKKEIECDFAKAVEKARRIGLTDEEIRAMLLLSLEEKND